jgi:hypothetical protein
MLLLAVENDVILPSAANRKFDQVTPEAVLSAPGSPAAPSAANRKFDQVTPEAVLSAPGSPAAAYVA